MKNSAFQTITICLLIYVILNMACQALDPIPITKFSSFIDTSNVSYNTATVASKFMDVGEDIVVYGHCWATTNQPTINDFKTTFTDPPGKQVVFNSNIYGLKSGTLYYIRAYFTTNDTTVYSSEISILSDHLSDIDGNIYNVVTYGNQIWMGENLKTTKYENGSYIWTTFPADAMIVNETEPKYQWSHYGIEAFVPTYGRLYTWYAATDSICPAGWHLPSDDEWTALIDYLTNNGYGFEGSGDDIAKSMADTIDWGPCDAPGTPGNELKSNNSCGFSALPGGLRMEIGSFMFMYTFCGFWSSSSNSEISATVWRFNYNDYKVVASDLSKKTGFSIRCIKD